MAIVLARDDDWKAIRTDNMCSPKTTQHFPVLKIFEILLRDGEVGIYIPLSIQRATLALI